MNPPEFDRYANSYRRLHAENIRITGESPDYFARYKVLHARRLAANRLPVRRILDFGCGIGNATPFLSEHFPDCEITGTDVSPASLDIARKNAGAAAKFLVMSEDAIPVDDGYFGLAFVSCVLHHIPGERHVSVLREIRRVMAAGALLAIYEHNPWNPLTVHAVKACEFDENAVLVSARRMKRIAVAAGFNDPRSRFIVFYPHTLRFLRWSEPMLDWLPLGAQYSVAAIR
jgi:SAM-dependent methyltransferase